jgi:hypothetical protein
MNRCSECKFRSSKRIVVKRSGSGGRLPSTLHRHHDPPPTARDNHVLWSAVWNYHRKTKFREKSVTRPKSHWATQPPHAQWEGQVFVTWYRETPERNNTISCEHGSLSPRQYSVWDNLVDALDRGPKLSHSAYQRFEITIVAPQYRWRTVDREILTGEWRLRRNRRRVIVVQSKLTGQYAYYLPSVWNSHTEWETARPLIQSLAKVIGETMDSEDRIRVWEAGVYEIRKNSGRNYGFFNDRPQPLTRTRSVRKR